MRQIVWYALKRSSAAGTSLPRAARNRKTRKNPTPHNRPPQSAASSFIGGRSAQGGGGERALDGLAGNVSSTTRGQGVRLGRRIDVGSRGHSRIPVIPSLTQHRCRPTRTPRLRVVSLFILLLPPLAFDYLRDLFVLVRQLVGRRRRAVADAARGAAPGPGRFRRREFAAHRRCCAGVIRNLRCCEVIAS
jgi:hypothetical protein